MRQNTGRSAQQRPVVWGFDFGHVFCRVAYGRPPAEGELERIAPLDYYGTPNHPAAVGRQLAPELWLSGHALEQTLQEDVPLQVFDNLRRRIIEPDAPAEVQGAARRLFHRLRHEALEIAKAEGTVGSALAVPLETGERERAVLRDVVGLPDLHFVNEPEAALLGYDLPARLDGKEKLVVVFDVGGAGCRCTVLRAALRQGVLLCEVLAHTAEANHGGKALDTLLLRRLRQAPNSELDARLDAERGEQGAEARAAAVQEVLWRLRQLRHRLHESADAQAATRISRLDGYEMTLTRDLLQSGLEDTVLGAQEVLDGALRAAGVSGQQVAHLLPVGGLTRLPALRTMMTGRVPQVEISSAQRADQLDVLCLARGAARYAAWRSAEEHGATRAVRFAPLQRPAFGVAVDGKLDVIIPPNAAPPLTRHKIYAAQDSETNAVRFQIFSGYTQSLSGCRAVGALEFGFKKTGLSGDWHRDECRLQVTMELVAEQRLKVAVEAQGEGGGERCSDTFVQNEAGEWKSAGSPYG